MFVVSKQRRPGLGRLGSQAIPLSMATVPYSATLVDTTGCVWDYLWGKSSFDACLTAANQNQIQTVANNAAQYYGANSPTTQVAQAIATQQEAQVPSDVQTIDTSYNLPASPFIPSLGPGVSLGDPSTWPVWLWIALGVGGLVLVKALK